VPPEIVAADIDLITQRVPPLPSSGQRLIIGIAGPPAAGKSTLTAELVHALNNRDGEGRWQMLGMDGFHLSNAVLEALDKRQRKGAPDTFDAWGFIALLERIRTVTDGPIYLPVFHREIEESIAAEAVVHPSTQGVVVEGNYLLLDQSGWAGVRASLDAAWYLDVPENVRVERLVDRATATYGSPEAGMDWAHRVDGPNAAIVESTRDRADLVLRR
jgi:pantothenate kinase